MKFEVGDKVRVLDGSEIEHYMDGYSNYTVEARDFKLKVPKE